MSLLQQMTEIITNMQKESTNIFVLFPHALKDKILQSISGLEDNTNTYHYGPNEDFAVIKNVPCKFGGFAKIVTINADNPNLSEAYREHIKSYDAFLETQTFFYQLVNKIEQFKKDNYICHSKIFIAIPLKYKAQLFEQTLEKYPDSTPFYYVNPEERFARIRGAICDFSDDYKEIYLFQEQTPDLHQKYVNIHEAYTAECRQNAKDYRNMLREDFYTRAKGKKIEIEVTKLFELAGFLIASSHYEDMGKMPYPYFQNISHRLGHELSEMIGESRTVFQTSYDIFDSLKDDKES